MKSGVCVISAWLAPFSNEKLATFTVTIPLKRDVINRFLGRFDEKSLERLPRDKQQIARRSVTVNDRGYLAYGLGEIGMRSDVEMNQLALTAGEHYEDKQDPTGHGRHQEIVRGR